MHNGYHIVFRALIIMALFGSLSLTSRNVNAQSLTHLGVPPENMVTLGGAVAPGGIVNLKVTGPQEIDTVPVGMALVLTDIVISPQTYPFQGDGNFLVQVIPSSQYFTTALTITASAANPTSLQVKLTSGMVFHAGSNVKVFLVFGSGPINISAFGYLVKAAL